jgi:hypothetical protein
MPVKLNQEVLETLEEDVLVRDTAVKGLMATRTKKKPVVFKVQHDLRGKTIRMTLDTRDLTEARIQARTIANQIAAGIDPRHRPEDRPSLTLRDAMLAYADRPELRASTREGIRGCIRNLNGIANRPLFSLRKSDCREAHQKIVSKAVANTTFRYVSACWAYHAKFDDEAKASDNPCSGVLWWPSKAKALRSFDLAVWFEDVRRVPVPRQQFHLLCLFGGVRVGTLKQTRWDWVAEDRITFPAAAMKSDRDFVLPLSTPMREIVASIPRLGEFVFPAYSASGHLSTHKEPILGDRIGHQLRKYNSSIAEAIGVPDLHLGALLDHSAPGLRRNYGSREVVFQTLLEHQERISAAIISAGNFTFPGS